MHTYIVTTAILTAFMALIKIFWLAQRFDIPQPKPGTVALDLVVKLGFLGWALYLLMQEV